MTRETRAAAGLTGRESQVLMALVRTYLERAEPIGSRTLAEGGEFDWSPATIRSTLAGLEEQGYLFQPHTSAGRIPTAKAYRYFVDQPADPPELGRGQQDLIRQRLAQRAGELGDLLLETSAVLSDMSGCTGVVLPPGISAAVLRHIDFIALDGTRVLAIVVAETGWVRKRVFDLPESVSQDELDRISRYLSGEFRGQPLARIRRRILQLMGEEKALYDQLMRSALDLGRRTFASESDSDSELIIGGVHNLFGFPELAESGQLRELVRAFEEKSRIVMLLNKCLEGDDVQVRIGPEDLRFGPPELSLVAAPYRRGGQLVGSLGILGPCRMPYPEIMALVDFTARVLSSFFAQRECDASESRGE